ncbi:MAG TPA: serine/threonine-protein kinase [Nannocystis sp.]
MTVPDTLIADTLASDSAGRAFVSERDDTGTATGGGRARQDDPGASPQRVGRYHVLGRIGSGGMGVVYSAYDPDLDRRVAVKLLRTDHGGRDSQLRLLREAQALARLSHPNVVQIYDTDAFGEQVFIAMEFIQGVDLHGWLTAAERSIDEILRVFLDAGRGLAAAHDAGLVHRDFKPDNVLVGADGRVCVADFGLARDGSEEARAPDAGQAARPLDMSLTATGALLGTPTYMSPEQHEGRVADARSDQFSFCVALWEALYGGRPFRGDSHAQIALAVTAGRITEPPADTRGPRRLIAVLRRGLVVAPAGRYPSMHALLAALAPRPRTRWRWLTAVGLAGLTGGAGLALADWRAREANACSGGAREIAAGWDEADHAVVTEALATGRDPGLAGRVVDGLDAYADGWVAAHRDACLVHRRDEQSSALFDARTRCLQQRRSALASAVDLLTAPAGPPPDAAQLVARLPAIASCSDVAVVMAEVAAPDDPALAAAVAEVEGALISARNQLHAGDLQGAERVAAAAVLEARRVGFRPTLAGALLTLATIEMNQARGAAAAGHLEEATAIAVATRQDAIAAESFSRAIFVEVVQNSGRVELALAQVPLARGFAERLPDPAAALARVASNEGTAHLARGDRARAAEAFARAVAESDRAVDVDPIDRAYYLASLAHTTEDPQRRDLLFARSEAGLTQLLGSQHPVVLRQRLMRARLGPDLAAARDLLRATCPALRERIPEDADSCSLCNYTLGHLELRLGDVAQAGAALVATRRCVEGQPDDADGQLQAHGAAALVASLAGDHAAAVAAVDASIATFAAYRDRPWIAADLAELELTRGRALLALGRRDEAITAFERAVTDLAAKHPMDHLTLPRLWLADARALLASTRGEGP